MPMHPGAFQARFDEEFVGALDTRAANGIAGGPKRCIANLVAATGEIAVTGSSELERFRGEVATFTECGQSSQHLGFLTV